jgi:hypothetical protein
MRDYSVGDSAYLKETELGYRYVEIIGQEPDGRLEVKTTSGHEFSIWADELE